jgi:threonine dehydrogenase-like Zn-dependent dehydrogenase
MAKTMKALVFAGRDRVELREEPIPEIGPNDALVKVTLTTICGTDVHIVQGEYPVSPGMTIGHGPVGVIEKRGANVKGYRLGKRVIAGAITPSAASYACLDGRCAQDGGRTSRGYNALGGWPCGV